MLLATLVLSMTITVYVPNCGFPGNGGTTTASGIRVSRAWHARGAACGPAWPFGTTFHVEGIGRVTCIDRGGAVGNRNIDVLYASGNCARDRRAAFAWGRRRRAVVIVRPIPSMRTLQKSDKL